MQKIIFGWENIFKDWEENPKRRILLVDENTEKYVLPKMLPLVSLADENILKIPSGEHNKNLSQIELLWKQLQNLQADRKTELVCIGGGVLCDMGAFAASTYMRGISLSFLPTTLLCMCDASIGGKTGMNFGHLKNAMGTFYPAHTIYIDTDVLKTLPEKELRSGFAEMIKHSLMMSKEDFNQVISLIKDHRHQDLMPYIKKSMAFKQNIIQQDPRESGLRKILNYGHSIGHAIESYYLNHNLPITHGEAVIAGIIIENKIAVLKKLIPEKTAKEIEDKLLSCYTPLTILEESLTEIQKYLLQDKKNDNKKAMLSLIIDYGKPEYNVSTDLYEVYEALQYYKNLNY